MKKLHSLLTTIVIITTAVLMLYYSKIIPSFGEWYSFDQSFRLQTEAFLKGKLAIQPVPYGHRHDWAWGSGMHQLWGLGVPFLQLPFNLLAKLFGVFGFPDRIIFLIFYIIISAIFWKALDSTATLGIPVEESFKKRVSNLPVFFFAFLNPGFIAMLRAKFGPYEEAIAYGYLVSFLLFALLILFANNRRVYLYFVICLLSGFSPIFRPTVGAYGLITFLLAFYLAKAGKMRLIWAGPFIFLIGIASILWTNYLRFNNPIEFGNFVGLTGSPMADYIGKFDNPVNWFPFTTSAKELLSALFFIDFYRLYVLNQGILWQSNPLRWFELNFKPYDFVTLVLLLLGWVVAAAAPLACRNKRPFLPDEKTKDLIKAAGTWSFVSFIMLFLFYSRWPGLLSRYLVDFGPAIVIGISILYLYLMDIISAYLPRKVSSPLNIAVCALFISWVFISIIQARIIPLYGHLSKVELTNVTTSEVAKKKLQEMRRTEGPSLPTVYRCGDQEYKYEIPYNNAGWDISASCTVSLVTTHFLENARCLGIYIEPIGGIPNWGAINYSDEEIEVKMGLERLHRISDIPWGYGKVIKYCSEEKNNDDSGIYKKFKLINIRWLNLQKHPNLSSPPLRLLSLEKVQ